MPDPALLSVRNLTVKFHTDEGIIHATENVSFDLSGSKTLGIVGESGSGKSVTALSIMRLISSPPGYIDSGEITYLNTFGNYVDLLKLKENELRRYRGKEIAMIFQEPMTSLNPVFTCGNQVLEALREHRTLTLKQAKERTYQLFEEVGLPRPADIYHSYPYQLSGGQKQRVMIAMAISGNPSILIADEPTTALDVTVQKNILNLLKTIQEKHGMAIIFISHDLGVIAEIADDVIVMYQGKIVESGHVRELFTNPHNPYTKGLLACRPSPEHHYNRLPTVDDFLSRSDGRSINNFIAGLSIKEKENKKRKDKISGRQPLLVLENIKTYFPVRKGLFGKTTGNVKAVDDVSFDVYPGETLGLVGESGCGKTTLGRTILKLTNPTSGKIYFRSKDITNLPPASMRPIRKNLQIIFQDPYSSLNPRLPVGSAVIEPMKVHGLYKNDIVRKEKALELLEKVNMEPSYFYRYPHELSGGQRQRICIARALAINPEFIICDESVSALDVSVQAQILNLLNDLKEDYGFTYIFISHDLSVVKFMSDRMAVMKDGKILELGDADNIYHHPKSDYTRGLIEAIPKGEFQNN